VPSIPASVIESAESTTTALAFPETVTLAQCPSTVTVFEFR
jgi:hypothetical protein